MRRSPQSQPDFEQLKAKLERGTAQAERGELLDGDMVFDDLRKLIQERRRVKEQVDRR